MSDSRDDGYAKLKNQQTPSRPFQPGLSPKMLDIRFSWEQRHKEAAIPEIFGEADSNRSTESQDSLTRPLLDRELEQIADTSAAAAAISSNHGSTAELHSNKKPFRKPFQEVHRKLFASDARGLTFAEGQKENLAPRLLFPPYKSVLSLLSHSKYKNSRVLPGILSRLIQKPMMAQDIQKRSALIYIDRSGVISILSTVDFAKPITARLFLHHYDSLVPREDNLPEEYLVSDFLESFVYRQPNLTNLLETRWWAIEISLPNGTILINSLTLTTYSDVYIFKFSPITGVLTRITLPEVNEAREYLIEHPNDPNMFPKVNQKMLLREGQKHSTQIGSSSIASRSMTNLASLLPPSLGKKISSASISNNLQNLGSSLSKTLINHVREYVVPTLTSWNLYSNDPQGYTAGQSLNQSSPNIRQIPDDFTPTTKRRPGFQRSGSSQYLKHPLQKLRQSCGSSVSLFSQSTSSLSSSTGPNQNAMTVPAIILTTPDKETRMLKLTNTITQSAPTSRARAFFQSIASSPPQKQPEAPTFVWWKDVFDTVVFQTAVPPNLQLIELELDTNMNDQVGYDLYRLLTAITEMYAEGAAGMQVDFMRMTLPKKESVGIQFTKLHKARRFVSDQSTDSFATAPESSSSAGVGDSVSAISDRVRDFNLEDSDGRTSSTGTRESIAFTDDLGSDSFEEHGRKLANLLRRDERVHVMLSPEEIDFSTVLMSQDEYIVDAVIAGWFADAGEWIKTSELQWKSTIYDRSNRV